MKIAIISDSHGNKSAVDKLFSNTHFDYLFYLGDGLGDLGLYGNLSNVYAVSGNCDFLSSIEDEKLVEIEGFKILITHGHKYGVKYSYDKLIERAKDVGAKIVCFGHTHRYLAEDVDGVYLINPGSFKRMDGESHGVMLTIENNSFSLSSIKIC